MATDARDPRSIVTPEAFRLDPSLIGMPLAAPSSRLKAILIDLALIGILTAILSNVQLFVWGGIALALIWLALKKSSRSVGQAAGVMMRTSFGCLGVLILTVVLGVWALKGRAGSKREAAIGDALSSMASPEMRRDIANTDYSGVDTPEEAVAIMERAARRMEDVPATVKRQLLRASVPPESPWAPMADSLATVAVARAADRTREPQPAPARADTTAETRAVAELSDAEVLSALAAGPADSTRARALRARAVEIVAEDTVDALEDELRKVRSSLADEREARQDVVKELDESRSGVAAFAGLLRDLWKQVGSAVGLWTVYFTVLTTVLRGQTIGKRVMRVRVQRLDGHPIGWWSAFERAGGYVAGIATGLLGFAQVLWDPNRQCIHDKIVGTVVVADGAERAAWEAEWQKRRATS